MPTLRHPLDDIIASKAKLRLCRLALEAREGLSARELARRTGMAKRSMDLALGELSGVGLMVREGVTARSPYRVNLEHELVQRVLIPLFAGEQTYVDAQFDALRVLIEESWRGRARFLYWGGVFGSVARGEETSDSDLDLAMIIDTPDQVSAVHDSASIAASVFSRRFGRRVSPLILSRPQFARLAAAGELLAEGLVRDGRRLAGEGDLTRMARGEAD